MDILFFRRRKKKRIEKYLYSVDCILIHISYFFLPCVHDKIGKFSMKKKTVSVNLWMSLIVAMWFRYGIRLFQWVITIPWNWDNRLLQSFAKRRQCESSADFFFFLSSLYWLQPLLRIPRDKEKKNVFCSICFEQLVQWKKKKKWNDNPFRNDEFSRLLWCVCQKSKCKQLTWKWRFDFKVSLKLEHLSASQQYTSDKCARLLSILLNTAHIMYYVTLIMIIK